MLTFIDIRLLIFAIECHRMWRWPYFKVKCFFFKIYAINNCAKTSWCIRQIYLDPYNPRRGVALVSSRKLHPSSIAWIFDFRQICKISPKAILASQFVVSVCPSVCPFVCYNLSHSSHRSDKKKCTKMAFVDFDFAIEWRHCENSTSWPWPTFLRSQIWNVNSSQMARASVKMLETTL